MAAMILRLHTTSGSGISRYACPAQGFGMAAAAWAQQRFAVAGSGARARSPRTRADLEVELHGCDCGRFEAVSYTYGSHQMMLHTKRRGNVQWMQAGHGPHQPSHQSARQLAAD